MVVHRGKGRGLLCVTVTADGEMSGWTGSWLSFELTKRGDEISALLTASRSGRYCVCAVCSRGYSVVFASSNFYRGGWEAFPLSFFSFFLLTVQAVQDKVFACCGVPPYGLSVIVHER